MKIVIEQAEIKQIIAEHLQSKFGSDYGFQCTNTSAYSDWTFEESTPEFLAAQAKQEAEMEEYRVKWAAEAKAKEEAEAAAKFAIDNAVTGNKS